MMDRIRRAAYRLRSPLLASYIEAAIERDGALPRPSGPARVHAAGANPHRLLLVGGSPVSGLGVASHELGLGGQLARRIAALTGRGVDLDLLTRRTLRVGDATALLRDAALTRYDVVILMVGKPEASALEPRSLWAREFGRLLDVVEERTSPGASIFNVPIPNLPDYIPLPATLARRVAQHVRGLNAISEELAEARSSVTVIPFAPTPVASPASFANQATYESWAEAIAPGVAVVLSSVSQVPHPSDPQEESKRQAALDRLGILDTPPREDFDRIVRMTRDALGVSGAALNFIDRDRKWTKAALAMSAEEEERIHTFCATTIERPELFVVEDAAERPEFADFPAVRAPQGVRFYAGYPIEAPGGERVGALCVTDTVPRRFSTADATILRELALRAQRLIWDSATEPPETP